MALVSAGEEALALHLDAVGISYVREYRFAPPRRWRADFMVDGPWMTNAPLPNPRFLVEVEGGSWNGGHRRGTEADKDTERHNAAVLGGWPVFRFTTADVNNGVALSTIETALGRRA